MKNKREKKEQTKLFSSLDLVVYWLYKRLIHCSNCETLLLFHYLLWSNSGQQCCLLFYFFKNIIYTKHTSSNVISTFIIGKYDKMDLAGLAVITRRLFNDINFLYDVKYEILDTIMLLSDLHISGTVPEAEGYISQLPYTTIPQSQDR